MILGIPKRTFQILVVVGLIAVVALTGVVQFAVVQPMETHLATNYNYVITVSGLYDTYDEQGTSVKDTYDVGQTMILKGSVEHYLLMNGSDYKITERLVVLKDTQYTLSSATGLEEVIDIGTGYSNTADQTERDVNTRTFQIPTDWGVPDKTSIVGILMTGTYTISGKEKIAGIPFPFTRTISDVILSVGKIYLSAPPNNPPLANANVIVDNSPNLGLTAIDYKSTSTDSDGLIVEWDWDFGDGQGRTTTDAGDAETYKSHIYYNAGTYEFSLVVSDDDGLTDTYTQAILVEADEDPDPDPDPTDTGTLSGYVKSASNTNPLEGATVTITDSAVIAGDILDSPQTTDATGYFEWELLLADYSDTDSRPLTSFEATITADGYVERSVELVVDVAGDWRLTTTGQQDDDDEDMDGDGIPDYLDTDIDGDGVPNDEDADPYDPDVGAVGQADPIIIFACVGVMLAGLVIPQLSWGRWVLIIGSIAGLLYYVFTLGWL